MSKKYTDRGLMKWAPFDALISYKEILNELKKNRSKITKPQLSDDQLEELDQNLIHAKEKKVVVVIDYYNDGFIMQTKGVIKKMDFEKRIIILSTQEVISALDIINLSF